ncbi:MAG: hydroxymethylbilane synthase [Planctomycetota bacterium]
MSATLTLGTRGSDLAIAQSRLIAEQLLEQAGVSTQLEVVSTTGDREQHLSPDKATWSMGAFVKELEDALLDHRIDLAVHSYKDMATAVTPGLQVAAVPARGAAHDVLVCSDAASAEDLRAALNAGTTSRCIIGTSSPRRSAQLRASLGCRVVPLRGNVPTRLRKLKQRAGSGEMHAICLAAAGLDRLCIRPEFTVTLPIESFPTAASQGALAVQTRAGESWVPEVAALDHAPTRRATDAERSFLSTIEAGCHTPAAAHAVCNGDIISLQAELFDAELKRASALCSGQNPLDVGREAGLCVLA